MKMSITYYFLTSFLLTTSFSYGAEVCSDISEQDARVLIEKIAIEEGLDKDLAAAVAQSESAFNTNAVSSTGAVGIMQLMPAVAQDEGVTDRCDPESNIRGGVRYLKKQIDRFGDPVLALAAYNAGPQRVMTAGGIPAYRETADYIVRVLNHWRYAKKISQLKADGKSTLNKNDMATVSLSSDNEPLSNSSNEPKENENGIWKDTHVWEFN